MDTGGGVDRLAAVIERVTELQQRVSTPPAEDFSRVLAARLTGPAPTAAPAVPAQGSGLTLGQMLGLPAAFAAAPASAPAAPAPAAGTGGMLLPVEGRHTSGFGTRVHPITGQHRLHAGLDIAAPTGTPFRAALAGTVSYAGPRGGYGNLVIVDHPDGTQTRYAHASRLDVRVGQQVAQGALLGAVGSTGASTGPHLHFEVRRGGEPVDPAPLLGL